MSWICPKCGATGSPGRVINQVCDCGSAVEDIDDDILKALLPFGPEKPKKRTKGPFTSAGILISMGILGMGAAFTLYRQEAAMRKKQKPEMPKMPWTMAGKK